jgi:hypothetical protein
MTGLAATRAVASARLLERVHSIGPTNAARLSLQRSCPHAGARRRVLRVDDVSTHAGR